MTRKKYINNVTRLALVAYKVHDELGLEPVSKNSVGAVIRKQKLMIERNPLKNYQAAWDALNETYLDFVKWSDQLRANKAN